MPRKVWICSEPLLFDIDSRSQTVFAFFCLQTFTTMLIKLSILLLYKRTFTIKSMRYAIYFVGFFVLSSAISNTLSFAFQCTPPAKFWNIELPGHCVNQPMLIMLASLFSFLTDFAIYIMPMPVIWRLQLTVRRKVELTLVFAVGGLYLPLTLRRNIQLRMS